MNASQPTMPVVSTTHQNSKPSTPTSIPAENKVLTVNNKQSTMENVRDSSTDKRHTFTTLTHEEKKVSFEFSILYIFDSVRIIYLDTEEWSTIHLKHYPYLYIEDILLYIFIFVQYSPSVLHSEE